MPILRAVATAFVLLVLLVPAPGTLAQQKQVQQPPQDEPGLVQIFNGVDLLGWTYGTVGAGQAKRGKGFRVKDGVLYSTTEDGGNLFTKREYGDFVLRLDFKLTKNANSGVGLRAPLDGDASFTGMEIQILDDDGP